ncbi:hypothetical protein KUCAC02_011072 [Chaenocephalus aceratus]|uniref:Uncharacterized protein n=1 Tax=Chaenocephalus aceratus TaxID=36190 RepID=A0ACB9WWA1_CHAAC|nr:hypothetical protein KUCAC02_011072 [Chaenocephalus aceratus]
MEGGCAGGGLRGVSLTPSAAPPLVLKAAPVMKDTTSMGQAALPWTNVVVTTMDVPTSPLTGVKSVVAVYVFFKELSITVTDRQETWVNVSYEEDILFSKPRDQCNSIIICRKFNNN